MNTSGEVADLMVKEGLMITEEVVKLTGLGAKNLAAIIIALLKEDNKTQGKTNMKKLLQSNKPLCILQIKESDLKQFNKEANKYGVLFTPIKDENNNTGLCDIIAKQDDVPQINRILEIMGYNKPEIEAEIEPEKDGENKDAPDKAQEEHSKNSNPRIRENQQERESTKCGDTEKEGNPSNGKPSVKKKVEEIKEQQKQQKADKAPEKAKSQQHTQSNKKKKKNKKKGKNR
ncbi:MAG: PcfB family protein [Ruminococcus sp.]|nr:PcfB family protein [Ruminococcus sp.]